MRSSWIWLVISGMCKLEKDKKQKCCSRYLLHFQAKGRNIIEKGAIGQQQHYGG